MNYTPFNTDYCVYKFKNTYLLVAQQFAKIIRQYVTEYQGLENVPSSIQIKGILSSTPSAKNINTVNYFLTDVEINQLRFDIN